MLQKAVIALGATFSAIVAIYFVRKISQSKTKKLPNDDSNSEKTNNNLNVKKTNIPNSKVENKLDSQNEDKGASHQSKLDAFIKSCVDDGDEALQLPEDPSHHSANLTNGKSPRPQEVKSLLSETAALPSNQSFSNPNDQNCKSYSVSTSQTVGNEKEKVLKEEELFLTEDKFSFTSKVNPSSSTSLEEPSTESTYDNVTDHRNKAANKNEGNSLCDNTATSTKFPLSTCLEALNSIPSSATVEIGSNPEESVLLNKNLEESACKSFIGLGVTCTDVVNVPPNCDNKELDLSDDSTCLANVEEKVHLNDSLMISTCVSQGDPSSLADEIFLMPSKNGKESCKFDSELLCKSESKDESQMSAQSERSNLDCKTSKLCDEETSEDEVTSVKDSSLTDDQMNENFVQRDSESDYCKEISPSQPATAAADENKGESLVDLNEASSDAPDVDASDCNIQVAAPIIENEKSCENSSLSTYCQNNDKESATDNISESCSYMEQYSDLNLPFSLLNPDVKSFEPNSQLVSKDEDQCSTDAIELSSKVLPCSSTSCATVHESSEGRVAPFTSEFELEVSERKNAMSQDVYPITSESEPTSIGISEAQSSTLSISEVTEPLESSSSIAIEWITDGGLNESSPSSDSTLACDTTSVLSNNELESYNDDALLTSKVDLESRSDSGKGTTTTNSSPSSDIPSMSISDGCDLGASEMLSDYGKSDDTQADSMEVSSLSSASTSIKAPQEMSLESSTDVQASTEVPSLSSRETKSDELSGGITMSDITLNSSENDATAISDSHYHSVWSTEAGTTETFFSQNSSLDLKSHVELEEKIQSDAPEIKYFYDNHRNAQLHTQQGSHPTDYKKLWPQPNDGLVFVPASPGQPLVPGYLRNLEFLKTRTIPTHNPATVAYLAKTMASLHYVPESWARIISISEDLQLRVRTDQRDMLCEAMERMGVCNPRSRPPKAEKLEVGSFVAARLDVPQRGVVWCRVHITEVVHPPEQAAPTERRSKNHRSKHKSWRAPEPLYRVEAIDHYPAASAQPLRAVDLRHLTDQAWNAPFYDQTICLLNTMPPGGLAYDSAARDFLLGVLREGSNFVRVAELYSTVIDGVMNYFGSLECYTDPVSGVRGVRHLENELKNSGFATSIYSGSLSNRYMFQYCMFQSGEAYWCNDNRVPISDTSSRGPSHEHQEYAFLCYELGPNVVGFRGFKLPFVHQLWNSQKLGLNINMHELCVLLKHPLSFVGDCEQVILRILGDPASVFRMGLYAEALHAIYVANVNCKPDATNVHYAMYFTQSQNAPLALPKDELNFLIPDTAFNFDKVFSVETLRKPISA